jgi:hypothetical protein
VSSLQGGRFDDGLKFSLIVSGLTEASLAMRAAMIEQSRLNPENASGISEGVRGDRFKLQGGRCIAGVVCSTQFESLLGGRQGGASKFFGSPSGYLLERVQEYFAGPHDFLSAPVWYNQMGNARNLQGVLRVFGEAYSFSSVIMAAPFAVAPAIPSYAYPLIKR